MEELDVNSCFGKSVSEMNAESNEQDTVKEDTIATPQLVNATKDRVRGPQGRRLPQRKSMMPAGESGQSKSSEAMNSDNKDIAYCGNVDSLSLTDPDSSSMLTVDSKGSFDTFYTCSDQSLLAESFYSVSGLENISSDFNKTFANMDSNEAPEGDLWEGNLQAMSDIVESVISKKANDPATMTIKPGYSEIALHHNFNDSIMPNSPSTALLEKATLQVSSSLEYSTVIHSGGDVLAASERGMPKPCSLSDVNLSTQNYVGNPSTVKTADVAKTTFSGNGRRKSCVFSRSPNKIIRLSTTVPAVGSTTTDIIFDEDVIRSQLCLEVNEEQNIAEAEEDALENHQKMFMHISLGLAVLTASILFYKYFIKR